METRVARLEQRLEDTIVRMDNRLLDLASDVRALSPLVIAHAEMGVKLTTAVAEAKAAHDSTEQLRQDLADREVEQRKERKSDRRWMIGTVLTTATLVVAALAVFLG